MIPFPGFKAAPRLLTREEVRARTNARPRDTQRARVYRSDPALEVLARPLPTVPDIEAYVSWLFRQKRVGDAYNVVRSWPLPAVRDGRGKRRATGGMTAITMPRWARNEAIVLHELAHVICLRIHGPARVASHGWEYCAIYLQLTRYAMGASAHDALREAFRKNRVRYTAPRAKRILTPEQKAALVARFAAGRRAAREGA